MIFKLQKSLQYLRIASYVCRPSIVQVRTLWKMPFSKDKDEHAIKNVAASKIEEQPEEESTSSFTDKFFKTVKPKNKNEFVKSTHGPGSSVKEFDYLLSMIPDKILGGRMKDSLRDLIKIAEGVYRRVGKIPVHPLVLNMALLRLYAIQSHEENQFLNRAVNDGDRSILTDEFTSEVLHYFKCASEVYLTDPTIRKQDILLNQLEDEDTLHLPRHLVFLDHITKSIVISIRGTASISDMITDLYIEASPFLHPSRGILAHKGISDSANALLPTITTAIKDIQQKNNGKYMNYRVVTTGHSLGAGTAALLAILLSTQSNIPVTSYAFAPPPVISDTNTISKHGFFNNIFNRSSKYTIHSFVHDRDFIPRCSHKELLNMLSALTAIDSLNWTDLERSTAIFHNELTSTEMSQIKDILHSNYHHIKDGQDTELYVPGQVYLLRPIPTTIIEKSRILSKPKYNEEYSSNTSRKTTPVNRNERSSDTEEELEDAGLSSSWLQLVKKTVSLRGKGVLSSTTSATADASGASTEDRGSSNGNTSGLEDRQGFIDSNSSTTSSRGSGSDSDSDEERKQDERLQYELIAVPSAGSLFNGLLYYGDSMVHDHLLSAYRKALIKLVK